MELRLDGKVALVTGGSRGIGKSIAQAFVKAGARVMITSRKAEACEEAVAEIGPGVAFEAGNIDHADEPGRVVEATLDRFGRIDILINNAATNPYAGPIIEIDRGRWDKTLSTNLAAPLFWTQQVWQGWMKEHGGAVINIASVGGFRTSPILGVYDITKSALMHMTKQLAAELAPHVRVNAIAPGLVKTDFAKALWQDGKGEAYAKSLPLERLGEVEDVAGAALFLVAESSRWVTGQTWVLDGGAMIAYPPTSRA
ncbi:MAG: SDR family oxidoreductase [Myxococcota bacterium]